ncbi:hypothetical protein B0H67DRAFT_641436 [Lasiosphaeris hirsuta]|uniref:Uncharacterized protein n=1 Tax=Lasiosphaeris hirsuta TaxID=260670 RepID=A0AA40AZR4_9PEZI|nr:hypothetical protein B0H67DRAFT_641436 [Lasiosphaeris hirsuta]
MPIQQVIALRYHDQQALYDVLNKLFPEPGAHTVAFEMGQYMLTLPRELSQQEILDIDRQQRHYKKRKERRRKTAK